MITCCKDCKPPKRTPTCHFDGTCPEYIAQKAAHDTRLEQINKAKFTDHNLYGQTGDRVRSANKRKKIK